MESSAAGRAVYRVPGTRTGVRRLLSIPVMTTWDIRTGGIRLDDCRSETPTRLKNFTCSSA